MHVIFELLVSSCEAYKHEIIEAESAKSWSVPNIGNWKVHMNMHGWNYNGEFIIALKTISDSH